MTNPDTMQNRRGFFRALGRSLAVGCLGSIGWVLARRSGGRIAERCDRSGRCRGCTKLNHCGLPRGLSARRVLNGNGDADG